MILLLLLSQYDSAPQRITVNMLKSQHRCKFVCECMCMRTEEHLHFLFQSVSPKTSTGTVLVLKISFTEAISKQSTIRLSVIYCRIFSCFLITAILFPFSKVLSFSFLHNLLLLPAALSLGSAEGNALLTCEKKENISTMMNEALVSRGYGKSGDWYYSHW
jgi:hypothetical protein